MPQRSKSLLPMRQRRFALRATDPRSTSATPRPGGGITATGRVAQSNGPKQNGPGVFTGAVCQWIMPRSRRNQTWREIIIFLISAIACAGFSPLGQVLAQFMIVWQR